MLQVERVALRVDEHQRKPEQFETVVLRLNKGELLTAGGVQDLLEPSDLTVGQLETIWAWDLGDAFARGTQSIVVGGVHGVKR